MLRWIDVIKFSKYGNPEPPARLEKTEEEWQKILSENQFNITRKKATERPYSGQYCRSYEPGKYHCVCCDTLLFTSYEKYNSISGWPSFTQPAGKNVLKHELDMSYGMKRIEVLCNVCDAHLGHVFPDGPEPGGLRYCINSECLKRVDDPNQLAVFGGGCFWCTEALIQRVEGVLQVEPGYSGGKGFKPTYREVSSGLTGHAEMLRVCFDPKVLSYENLLKLFFSIHNPSLINRDEGNYTQYRSIILYYNEDQKSIAEKVKAAWEMKSLKEIYTEIAPFKAFYPAEDKHFNYYQNNPDLPYCQNIIVPKMDMLRELLLDLKEKRGIFAQAKIN